MQVIVTLSAYISYCRRFALQQVCQRSSVKTSRRRERERERVVVVLSGRATSIQNELSLRRDRGSETDWLIAPWPALAKAIVKGATP